MNVIRYILLLLVFIGSSLSAVNFDLISELGSSARSIGMGNVDGFSDSSDAIFGNPSSLYRIKRAGVSLFTTTIFEAQYLALSYAMKTNIGSIGVGVYEYSMDGIPDTIAGSDGRGQITGYSTSKDSIYKLAYQGSITESLYFGVGASYYYHQLHPTVKGNAVNIDAGLIWKTNHYEFSLFGRNLIPDMALDYGSSSKTSVILPSQLVLSAKVPFYSLHFYPQIRRTSSVMTADLGLSYNPSFMPFLSFLAGYKQRLKANYQTTQYASIGIGLSFSGLQLHYAYEKGDEIVLDNKSYFSVNYNL